MIKRLRRRFIIVNISILTCVLVSILVSIFLMMYSSEVSISYELMESLLNQRTFDKNLPPEEYVSEKDSNINNNILLMNNFYDEVPHDDFNNWQDEHFNLPVPPDRNELPNDNDKPAKPDHFPNEDNEEVPPLPSPASTQAESEKPAVTEKIITEPTPTEAKPKITEINESVTKQDTIGNENKETKKITSTDVKMTSKSSVSTTKTSTSNANITSTEVESELPKKHDNFKPHDKNEPDPFKGKVKRSNIYVEFRDINELENIVYQYCTSENDDAVKEAVKEIFNNRKENGKISIGSDKYRYIFRFDPPEKKYCIIMLDRTLEINTINRLLFIFIIIAGAGLAFIVLISILLANWTIKPVAKSWNQQKEFIANASHELKTPLTVISTNIDVVMSSPEDPVKTQSKWLNYIKNETIRMSKLVNNLLCIAKYDANKIQLIYSKINISNLISSICLQYEPLIFENKKNLVIDIDNNLELVGDEDKIKQVVNILMDNALKYSLNNGTIKVSAKRIKQSSVCITVSNTSENIDKKHLEKIFDRFYRIDDSRNRKTGGSGLGLNIAKTIVESHKGTITAENNDNITSFKITF